MHFLHCRKLGTRRRVVVDHTLLVGVGVGDGDAGALRLCLPPSWAPERQAQASVHPSCCIWHLSLPQELLLRAHTCASLTPSTQSLRWTRGLDNARALPPSVSLIKQRCATEGCSKGGHLA